MCGIAGLYRPGGGDASALAGCAVRMGEALSHRGPDAAGLWSDPPVGVAFSHRRLSILDLTEAGSQPMRSACGRFTVTFNGEIYNHLELRAALEAAGAAPRWRGHSDTETFLAAVAHWGVTAALRRLAGMFAFALWNAEARTLTLARDRFGEKPLYYGWCGGDLVFGSELKALAAHPAWAPVLDRAALTSFMRYSYVPAPASIWEGIFKLPPGTEISFAAHAATGELPKPARYWSYADTMVRAQSARITDEAEAVGELERVLSSAIRRQCLSDVPLGAFLSGGIDSSTIVALMQANAMVPVRTFTIGFAESAYDEAQDARRVASHLRTDHTEWRIDAGTARDVIPHLPRIYDEPFADSSQIPTHLVAMLARRHVTVALSGDAGDELFGGYNRHVWGETLNARVLSRPAWLRALVSTLLRGLSPEPIDTLSRIANPIMPAGLRVRRAGAQAAKLASILGAGSLDDMYRLLCSIDSDPGATVLGGAEADGWAASEMRRLAAPLAPLDRMTLADALNYLSDDILHKVDRAAMAVSLETRVPFLDPDVAEFAVRIPPSMKVREGRGKWLVRQVLYKYVPHELVDRPKTGFSIPLAEWLRGPLRGWAGDLLAPGRLRQQGLFAPAAIATRLNEHMAGRRDHAYWLWNVLMAQSWLDQWGGRRPATVPPESSEVQPA